jgi:general secretion pathway protein A
MYTSYFGLSRKPFNATPDPAFLYTNRCYQEAYATLLYGVQERKGFIALIGEVGTGKTTLLRRLMDGMNPAIKVVFVYNTTLTFDELVEFICGELEIPVEGLARVARLQALNRFLIAEAKRGGTVVLLLDEAQNLSNEALENLRLISNLETATDKLLQIVLVGQPELETKLADPTLRQVTQRIAIRFRLEPLDDSEVEPYIDYRLRVVGSSRKELFSDKAVRRLIPQVKGIPRLINVICDNALVLAYATDRKRVTGEMIDSVIADLRVRPPDRPSAVAVTASEPRPPRRAAWSEEEPRGGGWGRRLGLTAAVALVFLGVGALAVAGAGDIVSRLLGIWTERPAWARPPAASVAVAPAVPPTPAAPPAPAAPVMTPTPTAPAAPTVPPTSTGPAAPPETEPVASPSTATPAGVEGAALTNGAAPDRSLPPREVRPPAAVPTSEPATAAMEERRLRDPATSSGRRRTLRVPDGGTISEIVFEHYGRYSSLALDLIHELNPDIRDLDVVSAGQPLSLPPLNLTTLLRRQPDGTHRLIVSAQPSLQAATKVAQAARDHGYAVAVTSREIASDQMLYRVEIIALKTQTAALRAWDTAKRLEWFELKPDTTERRPSRARNGLSSRR